MTEPRTTTSVLADALDILARDIQSGDGVANAAIAEAAGRLRELRVTLAQSRQWAEVCMERADVLSKCVRELRGTLQLIADKGGKESDTQEGPMCCNGSWCAEQARRALEEKP